MITNSAIHSLSRLKLIHTKALYPCFPKAHCIFRFASAFWAASFTAFLYLYYGCWFCRHFLQKNHSIYQGYLATWSIWCGVHPIFWLLIFVWSLCNLARRCINFDLSRHGKIVPSGAKRALGVRVNSWFPIA